VDDAAPAVGLGGTDEHVDERDAGTSGSGASGRDARALAVAAEQAHLVRVAERVEVLRARAEAEAAAVQADRLGSTFQAQYERDVLAHHHAARAARLSVGDDEALLFGRLDTTTGESLPVGRVHVSDEDGTLLSMDWRAPAAAPFYRATAREPLGVARRRVLVTQRARVVDVEDELVDSEAADRLGLEPVSGRGALLAALERERSPFLRDVVATIQADQDRIVRAPAVGTLVVSGGPGTGKTVVALHRVAYLLYDQRERLGPRGVLVVGPSRAFTTYTARVLPALGEDRVVQRPLEALGPSGIEVVGWDEPEVAAVKGDLAMVGLVRRLVHAALPAIPPETRVGVAGTTVVVTAAEVAGLRQRLLDRLAPDDERRTYHARTAGAVEALRELLWRRWCAAVEASGIEAPERRVDVDFDEVAEDSPTLRMLWRCYWPVLDAEAVLARARRDDVDLVRLGEGLLPADRLRLLSERWRDQPGWTVEDVAVLDEIDALLGARPRPDRAGASGDDEAGVREPAPPVIPVDLEDPWYRDFGHVVVDEAQDLTPLQWRSVARRGDYATWTVVGDLHQRSRVREPSTWEAIAALIGRSQVTIERLTVNYRSPAEHAPVALAVLAAAGHDTSGHPEAVRRSGRRPRLVLAEPLEAVGDVVAGLVAEGGGTLAVVAPPGTVEAARRALTRTIDADALERVAVHPPRAVKGLEFDDVVVLDPGGIAGASEVGLHDLYVALTRATRSLTVLARAADEVPGAEHLVLG